MFTFSAREILLPVFQAWMEAMTVTTFLAKNAFKLYKDCIGSHGFIDEVREYALEVYQDETTGNLMIFSNILSVIGILDWQGGEDMV